MTPKRVRVCAWHCCQAVLPEDEPSRLCGPGKGSHDHRALDAEIRRQIHDAQQRLTNRTRAR